MLPLAAFEGDSMGQETNKDLKKKHELADEQLDKVSGGARPEGVHIDNKHHEGGGGGSEHMDPNEIIRNP
jgi:hypothetical protein